MATGEEGRAGRAFNGWDARARVLLFFLIVGPVCAARQPAPPAASTNDPKTARDTTVLHLGGRVLGRPAHLVCLATIDAQRINLDFPVDGGCEGKPPTRVTYGYVDADSKTFPGGDRISLSKPLRTKRSMVEERRLRFAVRRWLPRPGGAPDSTWSPRDTVSRSPCRPTATVAAIRGAPTRVGSRRCRNEALADSLEALGDSLLALADCRR